MLEHQTPLPAVGDVLLGKYLVERVIGAGGMGVVVAVRHRDLGELFAMKFMLPAALQNAQAVERFVREARAAARLKSEHVAKVHDVGRLENGAPYMVMEYLQGQDLEGVLAARGTLPPEVAAEYVAQACDAIAEAHELGIIHRDLKPANLFLTQRANGTPCVKVLDFGISKSVSNDDKSASMTRTSAIMGSPYYMSPEQMRSSKNVDFRTDLWSLGVILYQLTTSRVPFPGETITEVCSSVLGDEPAPLAPHIPGTSPVFEQIVRRCLAKRSDDRFPNARELAAALKSVTPAGSGTLMFNPSLAESGSRLSPEAASRTVGAGTSGASGGASLGALDRDRGVGEKTRGTFSSTHPPAKEKSPFPLVVAGVLAVAAAVVAVFWFVRPPPGPLGTQPAVEAPSERDEAAARSAAPETSSASPGPSQTASAAASPPATETATPSATAVPSASSGAPAPTTTPTTVKTVRPPVVPTTKRPPSTSGGMW